VVQQSIADAVRACLSRLVEPGATLATLYYGHDVSGEQAQALGERLGQEFGLEVEVVAGHQPHYPYVLSVE
jgi:dihydroxyacetone kinase-like predicted kinase